MQSKFLLYFVIQCCFVFTSQAIERKTSLAFVMDTTGSMGDELELVKLSVMNITDQIYGAAVNTIEKLLLVPFNDPGFGPVISTQNPELLKAQVNYLDVYGGGDCPEMCLSGIRLALSESLPNSQIFVFTDASPGDEFRLPDILNIIKLKQLQVIFILTGKCDYRIPESYTSISEASSGYVFELDKTDVKQIIDWIEITMEDQVNNVNLDVTVNNPGSHDHFVLVDDNLGNISIGISGLKPKITIKDPTGNFVTETKIKIQVDLPKIQIAKVSNLNPGNWTISIDSDSKHSVKITSTSSIKFDYEFFMGFSEEAYSTPTIGVPFKLIIQVIDDHDIVDFVYYVELLDVTGKLIKRNFLSSMIDSNKMYTTSTFVFPNESFQISIIGITKEGNMFRRISSTVITPNIHDNSLNTFGVRPSIKNWIKNHVLEHGTNYTIECEASGTKPLQIIWATPQGRVPNPLRIVDSSKLHSGKYSCIVNNRIGESIETTNIFIWRKPYVVKHLNDIEVNLDSPITLFCAIDGTPTPVITWRIFDEEIPPSKYQQLGYASYLKIEKIDFIDNGNYTCTGQNEYGIASESFYLDVIVNTQSV